MALADIHSKLAELSQDNPTIAFDAESWASFVEKAVGEAIFSQELTVDVPFEKQSGLNCVLEIDASQLKTKVTGTAAVEIRKLSLRATLTAEGVSQGYLTKISIDFTRIRANVIAPNGIVSLEVDEFPIYRALPPDVSSPDRKLHLKQLEEVHGWSRADLDKFIERREPCFTGNLIEAYYPELLRETVIFDLSKLVPSIKFYGEIFIREVVTSAGDEIICFIPEFYKKKDPCDCDVEHVEETVRSGGSRADKDKGAIYFSEINKGVRQGYIDKPVGANKGMLYAYIPENSVEPLFGARKILEQKEDSLVSTQDSWKVGPFYVKHSYRLTFGHTLSFSLRQEGPVIEIEKLHKSTGHLSVYAKIGKLKHKICDADVEASHNLKYSGSLYADLTSGNLGFTGEFYDPTNIDYDFRVNTSLPDVIDTVFDRFLNDWCKPVVRLFLTYLLASVTWGFMSRFVFPSSGESAALVVAGYITTDQKSMTIAVDLYHG